MLNEGPDTSAIVLTAGCNVALLATDGDVAEHADEYLTEKPCRRQESLAASQTAKNGRSLSHPTDLDIGLLPSRLSTWLTLR